METRRVSAIVLAGGRSTRFGSDKLAADLHGRPLLHHAIGAVSQVADEVIVVLAADPPETALVAPPAVPIRAIRDREPFGGPLAGLREGAVAAHHPTLLVVGGDMPALVPAVLRLLLETVDGGALAAVLHMDAPAPTTPLPMALDRAAAMVAIDALLAADRRSLRGLLAELGAATLAPERWRPLDPDARTLHDVDRPEDLSRG